jgi:hypothetical protein
MTSEGTAYAGETGPTQQHPRTPSCHGHSVNSKLKREKWGKTNLEVVCRVLVRMVMVMLKSMFVVLIWVWRAPLLAEGSVDWTAEHNSQSTCPALHPSYRC